MKSNYKRLGNYIKEVTLRNTELKVSNLLGININKFFMPSVANVVGTDMSKYKIVKKRQFACNRMHVGRDKRLPVALWNEYEDIIVSPAYNVFEVINEDILDPEYLMMWFLRKEFDRNVWFYTDADVRGGLNWSDFCDLELPIPCIERQRELVKEYKVLQDRINLNNTLVEKLEDTMQTIYKHWFVEFNFPDESGKPYKACGGELIFDKKLEANIPLGWKGESYEDVIDFKTGKLNSDAAVETGKYPFFTCAPQTFKTNTFAFDTEAVLLAGNNASAVYPLKYYIGKFDAYQRTYVITSKSDYLSIKQIFFAIKGELDGFKGASSGTATKFLTMKILNDLKIVVPDCRIYEKFEYISTAMFNRILIIERANESLKNLSEILLSKLATVEG